MSVVDSLTLEALLPAGLGFIVGSILVYFALKPKNFDVDNLFSIKQMEKWHLDESWRDIFTKEKEARREFALKELETVENILKVRAEEYQVLKKEIRGTSEEFKSELDMIREENTPIVKYAYAQTTLAALTVKITNLRKKTEAHINAVLPTELRNEFLTLVRDQQPKHTIIQQMNREATFTQIKNNKTQQIDFLYSELDGLLGSDEKGSTELYNKLFGDAFE
jgi:hypothetical protein